MLAEIAIGRLSFPCIGGCLGLRAGLGLLVAVLAPVHRFVFVTVNLRDSALSLSARPGQEF
jgi:hypothetical protein